MTDMGKLEPPVLVIPYPLGHELIAEGLPVEIEYLQEDIVRDVVDCHRWGTK